ncbi:MAG: ABC transporter permease [Deltaproteobacteria bacterium]|nr:ABC transporter permease [Deltaproteobacteria bacterium]
MRQELTSFDGGTAIRQRRASPMAWLLAAPLFAWVVAFVVAPTLIMLVYSLCERGTLGGVVYHFTWENYAAVADPTYLNILVRSVVFSLVTTLACLVMGYPVAFYIGRAPEARRNLLLMLVMIPFWTSFLIRTYAWVTILKSEGLLNSVLLQVGMITQPFEMLYTPGAVILGLVYTFLPFMILPIYTSVEKLDNALIEAAFDLGAGPVRAFSKVIVPMTSPGITAGILLVFVPALGLYAVNDILGGGKVDMIGNIIENQFKGSARNWPFGAALGMTLVVAFAAALWYTGRRPRTA